MGYDIQDIVDDNPYRDNSPDPSPLPPTIRPDGYQEEKGDFESLDPALVQFNLLLSKWIEGLDSDDMDRVDRQAAANKWLTEYQKFKDGVISIEELSEFQPDGLEEMPGFSEYLQTTIEPLIPDELAIKKALEGLPEKLKGYITEENIIDVLKTVGAIEDPMTAIKRGMIAGIELPDIFGDWRDWKVFGTLGIPGIPLPPGIIDVTLGDIADAVGNIGGKISDFIEDPLGELDKMKDEIIGKVEEVFGGDAEDPGWGGSMGGFEDWIGGVLGGVIGGTILGTIYDEVSGYFEDESGPPVPPIGGKEEEDEAETEDEAEVDPEEEVDPNTSTVSSDTTDDADPGLPLGGDDIVDDDPPTGGPDCSQPRPEGPYTFATQAWDRKCGGSDTNTTSSDDGCPPGYSMNPTTDECEEDDKPTEAPEEGAEGGGGGGGGGGSYKGGILGLDYQTPALTGMFGPTGVDSVAALNSFISRQLTKRKPPSGRGGMLT